MERNHAIRQREEAESAVIERRAREMYLEDTACTAFGVLVAWERLTSNDVGEVVRSAYVAAARREAEGAR